MVFTEFSLAILQSQVTVNPDRSRNNHQKSSIKTGVLQVSQNSQESACARIYLLILRPISLLKKRLWHRCLPVDFVKFKRTLFLQNSSWQLLFDRSKRICQKQSRWLSSKYQYESCMIKNITQEAVVPQITFLWHFPGHFLYRTPGSSCSVFL